MPGLKEEAKHIFLSALKNLDIEKIIREKVEIKGEHLFINDEIFNLSDFQEIILIGFGKASLTMGAVIENLLGNRIDRGLLISDRRHPVGVESEVIIAGHPAPDNHSLNAGKKIFNMIRSCSDTSLVLFLISGGGSSLVELPIVPDLELDELRSLNLTLVNCGASIREVNTIRKFFSQIKGGRLGYEARQLRCISLYLSDVNPGDLRSIASNPLLPDDVSAREVFTIVENYGLIDKLSPSVIDIIERKMDSSLIDNWENPRFSSLLLLDNADALKSTSDVAERMGFHVVIDMNDSEGDYMNVADNLITLLLRLRRRHTSQKICLISGGEVSCSVTSDGIGGRNQEFVLYSAAKLASLGINDVAVLSCGSDGIDGNSIATGAVADAETILKSHNKGMDYSDYIKRNDSQSFFYRMGGLVITGPTGNNVRDIRLLLAERLL